jgi:hypothetical protein
LVAERSKGLRTRPRTRARATSQPRSAWRKSATAPARSRKPCGPPARISRSARAGESIATFASPQIWRFGLTPASSSATEGGIATTRWNDRSACRHGAGADPSEKEPRSTLSAVLGLWSNPVIDAATFASDFDLRDLRRRPTTIYVAVSLDPLPFVAQLLNVFSSSSKR